MDWKDSARPDCYRLFDLRRLHRIGIWLDIDKYRLCADVTDRPCRCNKGKRNGDDLISRTYAASNHGQVQRASTGVDTDAVLNSAISGKLCFESFYKRAGSKMATIEDAMKRIANVRFDRQALAFEIQKRNGVIFHCCHLLFRRRTNRAGCRLHRI